MRDEKRDAASVAEGVEKPGVTRAIVIAPVRLYREGMVGALADCDEIRVVGAASTLAEATQIVRERRPRVAVLDLTITEGPAAVLVLLEADPDLRVIALGVEETEQGVLSWAEAGAAGFVSREADLKSLERSVTRAACGELQCSPKIAAVLWNRVGRLAYGRRAMPSGQLSHREHQVAGLLELGISNKEIAVRLSIEPATVKNHVQSILRKTGSHRRGEAVARLRGVIASGTPSR